MAERADITVDYGVFSRASPRIVEVASPSLAVVVQDLVDTLRSGTLAAGEATLNNLDDDQIIDAAGKETLGGGVVVGITSTLLNAKLKFEDRAGPATVLTEVSGGNLVTFLSDVGLHTEADSGTVYGDSIGSFDTFGLAVGMDVINETDGSRAKVVTVDSGIQITTDGLAGGADDTFQAGDSVRVEGFVNPIEPSAFVTVSRTSATAAALLDAAPDVAVEVWKAQTSANQEPGSFGEYVSKKLLTFVKFLATK